MTEEKDINVKKYRRYSVALMRICAMVEPSLLAMVNIHFYPLTTSRRDYA